MSQQKFNCKRKRQILDFLGKCKNCGKIVHKEDDCWEIKNNKHKMTSRYYTPDKKGPLSMNDNDSVTELLLMEANHKEQLLWCKVCENLSHPEVDCYGWE